MIIPYQKVYAGRVCNMCGLECQIKFEENGEVNENSEIYNSILTDFAASGGYDSTPANGYGALDDGSNYSFSLCEFCLDHLFEKFKIAPKITSYMYYNGEEEFLPAETRVRMSGFSKENKKAFLEEQERRNKARNKI